MEKLWRDFRYGLRMLVKHPGFTLVAVITLALGVGANTAIFSVVNAVLLNPLPYHQPDSLMTLMESQPKNNISQQPVSFPNFSDWKEQNRAFEQLAAYRTAPFTLTDGGEPERINGVRVSTNLLDLLGLKPALGRSFLELEGKAGAEPVVMLGHGFWQRRYGADANLVGQSLALDGKKHTVVGILPAGLKFPTSEIDLWVPLIPQTHELVRGFRFLRSIGRLKPGITQAQAREEMEIVALRMEQQDPKYNSGWRVEVIPLYEQLVGRVRTGLLILLGAVGFVLLIACANMANLLLARATGRRMELAVRAALGADRWELIRQLLTESLLLGLLGGGFGLLLAVWGVPALAAISKGIIPRIEEISISFRVLGFTLLVSFLTGLLFGIAPALQASSAHFTETLKEGRRGSTGGILHRRLLSLLVVSEIALALVLLAGAGLMARSFMEISKVDPGFNPENLLTIAINLPVAKYKEQQQQVSFYQELLARVGSLPGVRSAAGVNKLPIVGFATANFTVQGRPVPSGDEPSADYRTVSPSYFQTLGIPLLKGRLLTEQDTEKSPDAVLINQTMAERFWPGEDPLGKRLQIATEATRFREIVGVVGDVKHTSLDLEMGSSIYIPFPQNSWANALRGGSLVVRTDRDPKAFVSAIRNELQVIDKDQAIAQVRTMEEIFSESLSQRRFNTLLLLLFAAIASLLAAIGIYGVMAYSVSQRTHELGIRMALGAQRSDLLKMVLGDGAKLAIAGIVAGLVAALVLTRLLASLLFGVSATDPATFAVISLLLAFTALLASYIPARRATKVDPIEALRQE